jgi:hypothetical protein
LSMPLLGLVVLWCSASDKSSVVLSSVESLLLRFLCSEGNAVELMSLDDCFGMDELIWVIASICM